MTIKGIKNKEVTVMGLGRMGGGVETVKFLARHGARVLVTDIKQQKDLEESIAMLKDIGRVEFVLGHHRKEDFIDKDFIVKNPGVPSNSPYLHLAREHNVPVETDISLFFTLSQASIIGVTGTKGKSTTATLIYELLKNSYTTFLTGNIGVTPLTILEDADANSLVVLELSSWQLEDVASFGVSPHISVITNIYEDHLDRHGNLAHYIEAKKTIVRFQTKGDIAILNDDDPEVRKFAQEIKGKVYYYSITHPVNGAFFNQSELFFDAQPQPIMNAADIVLQGAHNFSNIAAAVSVATLYKVSNKDIRATLSTFKGIMFRQELVGEIDGVALYNDTTATNPAATIASLKRFPGCILIAGGVDKHLDYTQLAQEIIENARALVLLPGSASEKIKLLVRKASLPVVETESLSEALDVARRQAKKGDVIVFSPGAASFNLFKNEFDRGRQFNALIEAFV